MTTFDGAGNHPLLEGWNTWISEPEHIWATESAELAARGESLATNDPFIASLVAAMLLGTLGPSGLRSASLYDDDRGSADTSESAHNLRRLITAVTDRSWHGRSLDAENLRSRAELELALAWGAIVRGEGWAIRVTRSGRSSWRLIDPRRIRNPAGQQNSARLRDGFVFDADGAVVGVWVVRSKIGAWGMPEDDRPMFVPWNAADGTPNIIYRKGYQLPGMTRAVSRLAPMIILSRQLKGVLESHVAAKRLQAIYGMITEAESPEAYAEAVTSGTALDPATLTIDSPLMAWVIPPGTKVAFTDTKFNGADLKDFLTICYKVQCATVQTPVDVVLCQMGEASLSSARAGLDQFDRTCQAEQSRHIAECTSVMDQVAIADGVLAGDLPALAGHPADIYAAKYALPPKYSTDRLKDAETIRALRASGVSGTTSFAMFGLVYEDESELRAAEERFDSTQHTTSGTGNAPTSTDPQDGDPPAVEDQDEGDDADQPAAAGPITINMPAARQATRYRIERDASGRATGVAVEEPPA